MLLGHFPQSYDYSTVGGWVVTRSSGQQSLRYGRIENLFHAGRLATFKGEFHVGGVPASSAGQDLRECVLGSEGRIGLLTEVAVRVRPMPEREEFHAVFFPDWDSALTAIRTLAQGDAGLSLARLSNEVETETQLALAGHPSLIRWLERYLRMRGVGAGKVMLLIGASGNTLAVRRALAGALSFCKTYRGIHAGQRPGAAWVRNRFRSAYLRNSLWDAGYAVDTMETCLEWPRVTPYMRAVEQAARDAFAADDVRVHAYTHLSHVYRQGCSAYSTFVWPAAGDRERELARWSRFKHAVSETIVKFRGTISHQHGVGADHAPYLAAEKGAVGIDLMRAIAREFDPDGLLNPGKLIP
jgi:alkyldihydroxyacetonephosphate synthase